MITASPIYGVRQWKFGDAGDEQFLSNYTDLNSAQRRSAKLDATTVDRMRGELQSQMVEPTTPDSAKPSVHHRPESR